MVNPQLVIMCSAAALAGLCANPYHQAGENPNTGSTVVADRALALGKALAAKLEAEIDAPGKIEDAVDAEKLKDAFVDLGAAHEKLRAAHEKALGEKAALVDQVGTLQAALASAAAPSPPALDTKPEPPAAEPDPKKKR